MVLVKIIYGPYESNGIIRHKKQRLWGLTNELKKQGYIVELQCTPLYERLLVEMLNNIIFQCNITNLRFNCICEDDIVCQRIVQAVVEAETRLYSISNMERIREILSMNEQLDIESDSYDEYLIKMIEDYSPSSCYPRIRDKQVKIGSGITYKHRKK